MRADPRIGASLDLRPVVHVFPRLAVAAIHGAMIDQHLAGGLYSLVVALRRRTPRPAHAALHEAAQEVVGNGLAISLVTPALGICVYRSGRRARSEIENQNFQKSKIRKSQNRKN
jgi:hypothetical protein